MQGRVAAPSVDAHSKRNLRNMDRQLNTKATGLTLTSDPDDYLGWIHVTDELPGQTIQCNALTKVITWHCLLLFDSNPNFHPYANNFRDDAELSSAVIQQNHWAASPRE
jgi:hypothetical protein